MSVPSQMQIYILNREAKNEIEMKLTDGLKDLGLYGNELDWTVQEGMDSRLSDIEEVIDIYNLETVQVR